MKKLIPLFCLGMIFGLAPLAHAEDDEEGTTAQTDQMGNPNPGIAADSQDSAEKPFKLTLEQREFLKNDQAFREYINKDHIMNKINGEYMYEEPPTKAQMSLADQQKLFKRSMRNIDQDKNRKLQDNNSEAKDDDND